MVNIATSDIITSHTSSLVNKGSKNIRNFSKITLVTYDITKTQIVTYYITYHLHDVIDNVMISLTM